MSEKIITVPILGTSHLDPPIGELRILKSVAKEIAQVALNCKTPYVLCPTILVEGKDATLVYVRLEHSPVENLINKAVTSDT